MTGEELFIEIGKIKNEDIIESVKFENIENEALEIYKVEFEKVLSKKSSVCNLADRG